MDLWCEYYKEHGHTLAHCREHKKVLDRLANEGKLGRFMNRNQQYQPYQFRRESYNNQGRDQNSDRKKEEQTSVTEGFINVIFGGYSEFYASNRSIKDSVHTLMKANITTNKNPTIPEMIFNEKLESPI